MTEKPPSKRDIRFCPYCFQQQFVVSAQEGGTVYCETCGIDVDVKDLVKP